MALDGGDSEIARKILNTKKICQNLQSDNKIFRKQSYIELQKYLSATDEEFSPTDLRNIFNETHIYFLNGLRDKSEPVREQAIKFVTFLIIDKLPLNDYYLTYLFPVLVERIGTVELVEESEEVRLQLVQLLESIIQKYFNTEQLKPFLNDIVIILCETVVDKYPVIKELSCKCITKLSQALPRDFHKQAESLIKPVLKAFTHQRYKIRVEAIKCIGDIVMHSSYKGIEEVVGPMAERLFDQIPLVRVTITQVTARWLLEYRDRYSFFHKLLPLILTGLNDEVVDTRNVAHQLWDVVGLQYQKENENDLKEQLDFLTKIPKYYPEHLKRPNLGCRVLVQRNVSKLAPAISRELISWQADVRVRCSQLLCAIALHAEGNLTQHLQAILPSMYTAARDEDQRVVVNILQASELIGLFIPVDTWIKIILPAIEDGAHYGHLTILAALIRGTPQEYIFKYLQEITKLLAEDYICQSRKMKYQRGLLNCVEAISAKYKPISDSNIGKNLFIIIVTLISLKDVENVDVIDISLLDLLYKTLNFTSHEELWCEFAPSLLGSINNDPKAWSMVTPERCIFETVLLQCGVAFGENLETIGNILVETLDPNADAESRLKTFIALSEALDKKDIIFKNAKNLNIFLETLVMEVLVPSLVWHAGRTAEAMRTIAGVCLCSALTPAPGIELFSSAEIFRPLFDKLLPLLISLAEDASSRSREYALQDIVLLKATACRNNCWTLDDLIKTYPEVLKRLDDPTDKVRLSSIKALQDTLNNFPVEFKKGTFKPHHELLIDTLLLHFDDDDDIVLQEMVLEVLKVMGEINFDLLIEKVNRHKPLLKNKSGCDTLLKYFNELHI